MRTLTSTLLAEHAKESVSPVDRVTIEQYGWPSAPAEIWSDLLNWTQAYTDASTKNFHGVCVAGDGSLNRMRVVTGNIHRQRVASPTLASDFTAWTDTTEDTSTPVCITALGTEVMIFWPTLNGVLFDWNYIRSADNGATWAAKVTIGTVVSFATAQSIAACHKANGDILVVMGYTDAAANRRLCVWQRNGGAWQATAIYGAPTAIAVDGIAVLHDEDWNMVAQVGDNLQSIIYGDAVHVADNTFSTPVNLDFSKARIRQVDLINNYISSGGTREQFLGITAVLQKYGIRPQNISNYSEFVQAAGLNNPILAGGELYNNNTWQQIAQVMNEVAELNSGFNSPFLCKPSGQPIILSATTGTHKWFYRLKPGTDFVDNEWQRAQKIVEASFSYGSAIAASSTHLWLSRCNDLYRSPIPCVWTTPTAGTGAGGSPVTLSDLETVQTDEQIGQGSCKVILNNANAVYDTLTAIEKGMRLSIYKGYNAEESEAGRFFVDNVKYSGGNSLGLVTIDAIDGWTLLERFTFPNDVEWNMESETKTAFQIIEYLVVAIGGTLTGTSKSALIDALYPHLEIPAGTSALSIVRRLLNLLPDKLFFFGNDGYIRYPHAYNNIEARYQFP